jgi:small subunit ribosomal protein S21
MTKKGRKILVNDGNVEKALRKLKNKVTDSGLLQELRDRQQYVKPTAKKKIAKSQAVRRWKKYLRDQQLPPKHF